MANIRNAFYKFTSIFHWRILVISASGIIQYNPVKMELLVITDKSQFMITFTCRRQFVPMSQETKSDAIENYLSRSNRKNDSHNSTKR